MIYETVQNMQQATANFTDSGAVNNLLERERSSLHT